MPLPRYLAQANLGAAHVKEIEGKTAGAIDKEGWLHSGDKGLVTDAWHVPSILKHVEMEPFLLRQVSSIDF